jgi:predicted PurR-regulated permease PerM
VSVLDFVKDLAEELAMNEMRRDLAGTVLGVLFIGLLTGSSLWIVKPFLGAVIWATLIAVATWPLMRTLERWLWGKRSLAVVVMTAALAAVILVPLLGAVWAIASHIDGITTFVEALPTYQIPPAPAWLVSLPLVGAKIGDGWQRAAASDIPTLLSRASPYLTGATKWAVAQLGSLGSLLVQFLLTIVVTIVLYAKGETAVVGVRAFCRRLAGAQGEGVVNLAGGAIRAVAMGIVVTALLQAIFAGIGLFIVGVPFAGPLTAVMFILAIAQIGPFPVLAGSVIWAYYSLGAVWGTVMLIWAIVAGLSDNFLKPILIKKGADLPFLLIFAGVLGGLFSLGMIGLFVGPVVLAVTYALLEAWVKGDTSPTPEPTEST